MKENNYICKEQDVMQKKVDNRGGVRPGAGRPSAGSEKRIVIHCCVSPKTKELIQQLNEKGIFIGREMDTFVKRLAIVYGLIEDDSPTYIEDEQQQKKEAGNST